MVNKFYVVLCKDDMAGDIIKIFDDPDVAVRYAKNYAIKNYEPDNLVEDTLEGYLYYAIDEGMGSSEVREVILNDC